MHPHNETKRNQVYGAPYTANTKSILRLDSSRLEQQKQSAGVDLPLQSAPVLRTDHLQGKNDNKTRKNRSQSAAHPIQPPSVPLPESHPSAVIIHPPSPTLARTSTNNTPGKGQEPPTPSTPERQFCHPPNCRTSRRQQRKCTSSPCGGFRRSMKKEIRSFVCPSGAREPSGRRLRNRPYRRRRRRRRRSHLTLERVVSRCGSRGRVGPRPLGRVSVLDEAGRGRPHSRERKKKGMVMLAGTGRRSGSRGRCWRAEERVARVHRTTVRAGLGARVFLWLGSSIRAGISSGLWASCGL